MSCIISAYKIAKESGGSKRTNLKLFWATIVMGVATKLYMIGLLKQQDMFKIEKEWLQLGIKSLIEEARKRR